MWYDELPSGKSWAALWSSHIRCENCTGIRPCEGVCPVCGNFPNTNDDRTMQVNDGAIIVEKRPNAHAIVISVNQQHVTLEHETASGTEIKAVAMAQGVCIQPTFALLVELSHGTSRIVADNDVVDLRELLRLTAIAPASMGAEGRYEDWVYLRMLEREWKRPVTEADILPGFENSQQPSSRAAIVILFWSYFETKIERLLQAGMRNVPQGLAEDTLQRYSAIGARLDRLYRVLFATTYWGDLSDLGYDDVSAHLREVQRSRNAFAHGVPNAISDALVASVITNLKREHEAWIAVYNRRGAHK